MTIIKKLVIQVSILVIGLIASINLNAQNLDQYRWENRLLIIQSNDKNTTLYTNQIKELSNSAYELKERKLIVFEVIGDQYRIINFSKNNNIDKWKTTDKAFHKLLNKKDDVNIILIGLDGGIKLEKNKLLTKQELFNTIDAMPMRRAELRRKKRN